MDNKKLIEITNEEFNLLPTDRKKIVYGIEHAREAAYFYRCGYCAIVNALKEILCTDPIGDALYDKIISKTSKDRKKAEESLKIQKKDENLIERIKAIDSWKKEVKRKFQNNEG